MISDYEAVAARLAQSLRSSVNPDGGWGYSPGKASRLEPTSWSLLALLERGAGPGAGELVHAALEQMIGWQRADGLLSDISTAPPNLAFNGLAAAVLSRSLTTPLTDTWRYARTADALIAGILGTMGTRLGRSQHQRQDNDLVGWPWNEGTFSWVEPTSWCLLALKKAQRRSSGQARSNRIHDAERMLEDRCCLSGGWNYGNSNILGKELSPYVPTTALALLALRDRPESPAVKRSLDWLRHNQTRENSSMALSLALIAMRVYGAGVEELAHAVCERVNRAGPPVNLATTALVAYALSGISNGCDALAI